MKKQTEKQKLMTKIFAIVQHVDQADRIYRLLKREQKKAFDKGSDTGFFKQH